MITVSSYDILTKLPIHNEGELALVKEENKIYQYNEGWKPIKIEGNGLQLSLYEINQNEEDGCYKGENYEDDKKKDYDFDKVILESYRVKKTNKLDFEMEINIKFFKSKIKNKFNDNNKDLFGLLKLCLLKEIAIKNFTKEFRKVLPEKYKNAVLSDFDFRCRNS